MTEPLTRATAQGALRRPRALLVDVGFTLTAPEGARIAPLARAAGVDVTAAAIDGCERAIREELAQHAWPQRPDSAVPGVGGVRFFRRVLELAGAGGPDDALGAAAARIWSAHLEDNLWSRPLDGVETALDRLRGAGVRLAVVSNSEGTIDALLASIGLRAHFEVVIDSWRVGVAKPDPRIFHLALEPLGVAPGDAAMIGDSPALDVEGAEAAGLTGILVDPWDLYPALAVPRFPSLAAFASAVTSAPG